MKLTENTDVTLYPSNYYEIDNGTVKINLLNSGDLIATVSGTTTEHIHTDHLGSTHVITDNGGVTTKLKDYYPFGDVRIDSGSSNEDNGFTGYEKDVVTGLDYAEARYYNSQTGRFISQDPVALSFGDTGPIEEMTGKHLQVYLAEPQNLNTYSYVMNNPVKYVDPEGEATFSLSFDTTLGLLGAGLTLTLDTEKGLQGLVRYGVSIGLGADLSANYDPDGQITDYNNTRVRSNDFQIVPGVAWWNESESGDFNPYAPWDTSRNTEIQGGIDLGADISYTAVEFEESGILLEFSQDPESTKEENTISDERTRSRNTNKSDD